jgi:hypothetical protein
MNMVHLAMSQVLAKGHYKSFTRADWLSGHAVSLTVDFLRRETFA